MKKNTYNKPENIVVDGEVVNFHYKRDDRLKMTGVLIDNEKTTFFSKKYRYLHIMLADLLIIAIIGVILTSFYGRTKSIIYNDIKYLFSRKSYSNNSIMSFNIQIKNESSEIRELPGNYFNCYLLDENNNKTFSKEIFIQKTRFMPSEFYIENIVINTITPGSHTFIFIIENNTQFEMNFKTK